MRRRKCLHKSRKKRTTPKSEKEHEKKEGQLLGGGVRPNLVEDLRTCRGGSGEKTKNQKGC